MISSNNTHSDFIQYDLAYIETYESEAIVQKCWKMAFIKRKTANNKCQYWKDSGWWVVHVLLGGPQLGKN